MTSKDTIDTLNRLEFFYWDKPTKTLEILEQDKEQVKRDFALIRKDLEILEQYKNIEKELGIDLITLFKALKNGAWFKYDYDMFEYVEAKRLYLRTDVAPCAIDYLENVEKHYLKNYGKTWALTKEEL